VFDRLQKWFDWVTREREPRPPIIPEPWRIPFYFGISLLSLAALVALVWFVVIPGITAQQAGSSGSAGVSAGGAGASK
jgi:hypothetical protein